jgi:hypothetical protein
LEASRRQRLLQALLPCWADSLSFSSAFWRSRNYLLEKKKIGIPLLHEVNMNSRLLLGGIEYDVYLNPLALMYFLPQPWQVYGLSLVCSLLWSLRCTNCVNLAGQRSQAYGF